MQPGLLGSKQCARSTTTALVKRSLFLYAFWLYLHEHAAFSI